METIEDKIKMSELLELYGGLLTERQRNFMNLHFNEDLSFGEIADTENISRQAVHDTIQHAKKYLLNYDKELHLKQYLGNSYPQGNYPEDILGSVHQLANELYNMVKDDILYDTTLLRRKLKLLCDMTGAGESSHNV